MKYNYSIAALVAIVLAVSHVDAQPQPPYAGAYPPRSYAQAAQQQPGGDQFGGQFGGQGFGSAGIGYGYGSASANVNPQQQSSFAPPQMSSGDRLQYLNQLGQLSGYPWEQLVQNPQFQAFLRRFNQQQRPDELPQQFRARILNDMQLGSHLGGGGF